MSLRLKNNIAFVKSVDLWGTMEKHPRRKGGYRALKYKYLMTLKTFMKLKKFHPRKCGENTKKDFFSIISNNYLKYLFLKNRNFLNSRRVFLSSIGRYKAGGKLFFTLKLFKAFLFPKLNEKRFKRFFRNRTGFFNKPSEMLFYQFQTMVGTIVMKLGFFYSFYGLQRVMGSGLFKVNGKITKSRFSSYLLGDILTFSPLFYKYLRKKFLRRLKRFYGSSFFLMFVPFIEVNYRFLWFFYFRYPKFSSEFNTRDLTFKSTISYRQWLSTARTVSRF